MDSGRAPVADMPSLIAWTGSQKRFSPSFFKLPRVVFAAMKKSELFSGGAQPPEWDGEQGRNCRRLFDLSWFGALYIPSKN